jgi:UDP-N-acetyl-D-glucosamine dehydrogenase
VREAPAVRIMHELAEEGVAVSYHDPLVRSLEVDDQLALLSVPQPRPSDYDLALVVTLHDHHDYEWLDDFDQVLDCTYQTPLGRTRALV